MSGHDAWVLHRHFDYVRILNPTVEARNCGNWHFEAQPQRVPGLLTSTNLRLWKRLALIAAVSLDVRPQARSPE